MYKHTQTGWVIIYSFTAALLAILAVHFFSPSVPPLILELVIFLCIPLFATLTVSIKSRILHIVFGIGLIRMRFKLDEVISCKIVRNQWWCGYGIHGWFKKGWLINVSGLDAVELKIKNGMAYRIGTDEPQKLHEAIQAEMKALGQ